MVQVVRQVAWQSVPLLFRDLFRELRDNLMLKSPAIENDIIESRPLTVVEAMRELVEVRAIPVKIKSTTMWVRTDINGNAAKLLLAIGLKPPPKVLHINKTTES